MSTDEKFEGWAILELMGHRRLAGKVREVTMFGSAMARIDIPSDPPITQYYGGSSIFSMTPTDEATATRIARPDWRTPAPLLGARAAAADDDIASGDDNMNEDDPADERDANGDPLF